MAIVIEITSEERAALDGLRKMATALGGVEDGAKKLAKEARDAAKANQELEQAAKRVLSEIATPQEQYNKKMAELDTLLKNAKISQVEFGKAAGNAADKLHDAETAGKSAFGAESVGKVASFASALLGVGGAASTAIALLERLRETREKAAEESRRAEFSGGSLAQLAIDPLSGKADPKRFKELTDIAAKLQVQGGFKSRDEANQVTFSLASAGLEKDAGLFGEMHASSVFKNVATMARGVDTIATSFPEAGDSRKILNHVLAAGGYAPTVAEELAPAIARGGPAAKAAGIQFPELAAATAVVSKAMGSADQAGTYTAQFMRTMGKIGSGGVGELGNEDLLSGASEGANLQAVWTAMHGKKLETPGERADREREESHLKAALKRGSLSKEALNTEIQKAKKKFWKGEISKEDYESSTDRLTQQEFDAKMLALQPDREEKPKGPLFDFKGKSLIEQMDMIDKAGLPEAQLQKLFGRAQSLQAFRIIMQNRKKYAQALTSIDAAGENDPLTGMMKLTRGDRGLASSQLERQGEAELNAATEAWGDVSKLYNASEAHVKAQVARGDVDTTWGKELTVAMGGMINSMMTRLPGMKETAMGGWLREGRLDDSPALKEAVTMLLNTSKELSAAAKDISEAAANAPRRNTTLAPPNQDR